jgi:photosystem II stability/assembly factor-like uncharacterized protein
MFAPLKYGVVFFALLFHSLVSAQTVLKTVYFEIPSVFSQVVNDPKNPNILYSLEGNKYVSTHVYRSRDAGVTWQQVSAPPITHMSINKLVLSSDSKVLFALVGYINDLGSTLDISNVFKSLDQGDTWQPLTNHNHCVGSSLRFSPEYLLNNPSPNTKCLFFNDLIPDPSNPKVLYAINDEASLDNYMTGGIIKKSEDGGETWFGIGTEIVFKPWSDANAPEWMISNNRQLVIDPVNPQRLYVTNDTVFGDLRDMFYVSENAGITWKKLENNLPQRADPNNLFKVDKLWVHPTASNVLYLRTRQYLPPTSQAIPTGYDASLMFDSKNFRSTDYGKTWTDITQGTLGILDPKFIEYGRDDLGVAHVIYVALPNKKLIYKGVVGFDPQNPNIIYNKVTRHIAGDIWSYIYRSEDAGQTWQKTSFAGQGEITGDVIVQSTGQLMVTTTSHLYKGSGDNWQGFQISPNVGISKAQNLSQWGSMRGVNSNASCVGSASNNYDPIIFCSTDGGNSYTRMMTSPDVETNQDMSLSIPRLLYISAGEIYADSAENVYKTSDNGKTWQNVFSGMNNAKFTGDLPTFIDDKTLYLKTFSPQIIPYYTLTSQNHFIYTQDKGSTWQEVMPPEQAAVEVGTRSWLVDPKTQTVYMRQCSRPIPATDNYYQLANARSDIFKSNDHGVTWKKITPQNDVLLSPYVDCAWIDVQIDNTDSNRWYLSLTTFGGYWGDLGASNRLYRSLDGGDTWQKISAFPQESDKHHEELSLDGVSGSIYNFTRDTTTNGYPGEIAAYRSDDAGNTWQLINIPEFTYPSITILNVTKGILYRNGSTGLYRSLDKGNSWQWLYSGDASLSSLDGLEPVYMTSGDDLKMLQFNSEPLNAATRTRQADVYAQNALITTFVNQQATQQITLKPQDDIHITASISPVSEHQGQSVELLVVARFQPKDSTQTYWFMRTNDAWQAWDGSWDGLKPVKTLSRLQTLETVDIFTGKPEGLTGTTTIFTGYRVLSEDNIVYNRPNPLVLTVGE